MIILISNTYFYSTTVVLYEKHNELNFHCNNFTKIQELDTYFMVLLLISTGLAELRNELQTWDWNYGRTPVFTVSRAFPVPAELLAPSEVYSATQELIINMTVENGLISDVTLNIPPGLIESGFHGEASVITHLKGKKFTSEALNALQDAMLTRHLNTDVRKLDDKEQFVAKCFDQVVNTM